MSSAARSAGLLMFRRSESGRIEVFLVHPGGPFFARRDAGVWSIPKGEIEDGADPLAVAVREFEEETGLPVEACRRGELIPLGAIRQRSGKIVEAWAFPGEWPESAVLRSNRFPLEWPPRSGRIQEFPEVDRGEFFTAERARIQMNAAQAVLIDRLLEALSSSH